MGSVLLEEAPYPAEGPETRWLYTAGAEVVVAARGVVGKWVPVLLGELMGWKRVPGERLSYVAGMAVPELVRSRRL